MPRDWNGFGTALNRRLPECVATKAPDLHDVRMLEACQRFRLEPHPIRLRLVSGVFGIQHLGQELGAERYVLDDVDPRPFRHRDALTLDGRAAAAAALNPALIADADADIKARITEVEFYIRICASAVADVDLLGITVHADADATVCLALTPVGPTTCSCARGGDQPDDDSDQPDGGDEHGSGAF
jgi:hypothetical protein